MKPVVYFKCMCKSSDRQRARQLRAEGYEVKVVKSNPLLRLEAKDYGLRMPFVVENGKARAL